MGGNTVPILLALAGVAVVAFLLRRLAGGGDATTGSVPTVPEAAPAPVAEADEDDDAVDADAPAIAAMTSDGLAFIGEDHAVRVVPVRAEGGIAAEPNAYAPSVGELLRAGDFTAARVVRGAPDHDPWRLELLGREGEFLPFAFETEDAARTAMELLEAREVVRFETDEHDRPIRPSAEQFEEARRRYDETERELANLGDEEP